MLAVVAVSLIAATGLPQGEVAPRYPAAVETAASRIFNSTMSPFCPGLLIANCPSPGAAALKDRVREQLAAGVPPDSVRALLYAQYGPELRATPPAQGFDLLAWIIPGVGLLVGGAAVTWWLRRSWRVGVAAAAAPALDPEAEARLARALAEL